MQYSSAHVALVHLYRLAAWLIEFDKVADPLARAWKLRRMGDLAWQHGQSEKLLYLWARSTDLFEQRGYEKEVRRTTQMLAELRLRGQLRQ